MQEGKDTENEKETHRKKEKEKEKEEATQKQEEGKEQQVPRNQCWRCWTCGDGWDDPHCTKHDWCQPTPLWLEVQLQEFRAHKEMQKQKEKEKEQEDKRVKEQGAPLAGPSWAMLGDLDHVAAVLLVEAMPLGSCGPTREAVQQLSQELGRQQLEELSRLRRVVIHLQRQLQQDHQNRMQHKQQHRYLLQKLHMQQQQLQQQQQLLVMAKPRPPRPPPLHNPFLVAPQTKGGEGEGQEEAGGEGYGGEEGHGKGQGGRQR